MSDEPDLDHDARELAAAQLVAIVKRTQAGDLELPIVDETCVWIVSVKRMGIRDDGSNLEHP
jgi:hypothetical protein